MSKRVASCNGCRAYRIGSCKLGHQIGRLRKNDGTVVIAKRKGSCTTKCKTDADVEYYLRLQE